MSAPQWCFGGFRLDPDTARLWHGTQAIALPPKAFAVLHYLVTHPDRLVTKDELLDAVWPETAVSDAVVRIAIGELRRALGDTVQAPRFIATVPRRGYRFLAPVTLAFPSDTTASPAALPSSSILAMPLQPVPAARPLVGREAVLERLRAALTQARQGQRQVLFLTGEPGIGKTAVVEAFAAQARQDPALWLASGQCIEHYGPREPYLPVLEALGQLCRGPAGARLETLLRQQAPTWLVQLPWLLTPADREHWPQELQGTTRQRMLREFATLLETLTAATPLVLLLEDLHWSDHATLDLLALLARRRAPAQFLLLGTYRPVETIVHGHPLRTVVQDLQRSGHATALPLTPLTAEAVTAYLAARFPGHHFPESLARWLHEHTDGNPLFLETMVAALVERGILTEQAGAWTVQGPLDAGALGVPEEVRSLLEQQLERLPPEAQQTVEVASVAGVTFTAAAVAAGLEASTAQLETRCEALARYHLVRPVGLTHWPDGTATTHYTFTHALYQQVAYARLGLGRRVHLHQRLGTRLAAAYGARASEIAAELAVHFESGRDYRRAVPYLQQAAANALRRCAHEEAIRLLTKGLELLTGLPDTPERAQQELRLQSTLGPVLIAARGYAAPDVAHAYARARDLGQRLGDIPQLFVALRGLQLFHVVRAELQTASELAETLLCLARRQHDPTLLVFAHLARGILLFHRGAFGQARVHLAQGMALDGPALQQAQAFLNGNDAMVVCLAWMALTLWLLGYPEQAQQRGHEALTRARQLAQPFSLAFALDWGAWLHQLRREPGATQAQAEAAMAVCTEQGFAQLLAFGRLLRGWALAVRHSGDEGIAHLHQGLAAYQATGAAVGRPQYLALLAEAQGQGGQPAVGLAVLREAFTVVGQTGERSYEAELHRLTGQLLWARSGAPSREAETCFRQALDIARRQQARALELRAATSLARLWQQQGQRAAARALLAPVYHGFTEGFDTADLREARALLAVLA